MNNDIQNVITILLNDHKRMFDNNGGIKLIPAEKLKMVHIRIFNKYKLFLDDIDSYIKYERQYNYDLITIYAQTKLFTSLNLIDTKFMEYFNYFMDESINARNLMIDAFVNFIRSNNFTEDITMYFLNFFDTMCHELNINLFVKIEDMFSENINIKINTN